MALLKIDRCPGILEAGYETYSPKCKMMMFGSRTKNISHILPFLPPYKDPEVGRAFQENRQRISISGVQEKYSMALIKKRLELVETHGQYILKPISGDLLNREFMPANEHLTMQIARQIFGIDTAANALIFFSDGSPAYLTRRFDYKSDGTKFQVEDFATLLEKTEEREGVDYKYNASYEDIGRMISRYVPAAPIALENFFRIVVFNYLFSNGDAHLKNFSLIESLDGDYVLAPAYDLHCTRLHINDGDLGLRDGLYDGDFQSPSFADYGVYTYKSFIEFAERISLPGSRSAVILDEMLQKIPQVEPFVRRSFLSGTLKKEYMNYLLEKERRFRLKT